MASLVREDYSEECERLINAQVNMELNASYIYMYMGYYFDKDTIALPGLAKFFKEASKEERDHAEMFMKYQNDRGGCLVMREIQAPKQEFSGALDALTTALELEKAVYKSIRDMHSKAAELGDCHLTKFLDDHFLDEQVQSIKQLADYITQLKRAGPTGLGEYIFDKNLK